MKGGAIDGPHRTVGRDDGDSPESRAEFQRRGPLAGPVVLRQGPGQPDVGQAQRGRRQGARDDQVPGPAPAPRRQAAGLVHAARTSAPRASRASTSGRPCCWPTSRGLLQSAAGPPGEADHRAAAAVRADRRRHGAGARADGPAAGRRTAAADGPGRRAAARRAPRLPRAGARKDRPGPAPGRRGHAAAGDGPGADRVARPARGPPGPRPGKVRPATASQAAAAGRRQAGQPQRQAAAGLRARRAGDPDPEPGGHRPGPPPAAADRRLGAREALVARAAAAPRQVRPRGPPAPGPARRGPHGTAPPAYAATAANGIVARRGGGARPAQRHGAAVGRRRAPRDPPVRPPQGPGGAGRAAGPDRPAPAPPDRGRGRPADDALGRRPALAVRASTSAPSWGASGGPGAASLRGGGERPDGPGRAAGPRCPACWSWASAAPPGSTTLGVMPWILRLRHEKEIIFAEPQQDLMLGRILAETAGPAAGAGRDARSSRRSTPRRGPA